MKSGSTVARRLQRLGCFKQDHEEHRIGVFHPVDEAAPLTSWTTTIIKFPNIDHFMICSADTCKAAREASHRTHLSWKQYLFFRNHRKLKHESSIGFSFRNLKLNDSFRMRDRLRTIFEFIVLFQVQGFHYCKWR